MPYVLVNEKGVVEATSKSPIFDSSWKNVFINQKQKLDSLLGKRIAFSSFPDIKIAVVCNWNSKCGISTYSKFLCNYLKPLVKEVKIFSEIGGDEINDIQDNVIRCWKRGESLSNLLKKIEEWGADFVLIQHEFGIFPSATHWLNFLSNLKIPYAVVLHSVYKHLDKTIHTAAMKNIIVHSVQAKDILVSLGHQVNIQVIPHGCVVFDNVKELWNTFQTPYSIVQFGFGFAYKGVDRALKAVAYLKKNDPKFQNIFYCYLCSETNHASQVQTKYVEDLQKLAVELEIQNNVAIIQKFHSEEIINNYLRTAKLAIFPYLINADNMVYGASGAIRVAMANYIPTIASESHLFDDIEGILPRPDNEINLAREIDEIFSCQVYRESIVKKARNYVEKNNWRIAADKYLLVIKEILEKDQIFTVL